jgi:hypothetical protein
LIETRIIQRSLRLAQYFGPGRLRLLLPLTRTTLSLVAATRGTRPCVATFLRRRYVSRVIGEHRYSHGHPWTHDLLPTDNVMYASPVFSCRRLNASIIPDGVSDMAIDIRLRSSSIFCSLFSVFIRPDVLPLRGEGALERASMTPRFPTYWNLCDRDFHASLGVMTASDD